MSCRNESDSQGQPANKAEEQAKATATGKVGDEPAGKKTEKSSTIPIGPCGMLASSWFIGNIVERGATHEAATKAYGTAATIGSVGGITAGVAAEGTLIAAGGRSLTALGTWLSTQADKVAKWVQGLGSSSSAPQQVQSFANRAEARSAFSGDLGQAANRFFRGATSKSLDYQSIDLRGGLKQFQFFSPANNPGYGKLYVQVVDRTGKVMREYKNTMGPAGLIERKWITGGK